MSLITKNNYEAFLLDYVEGNLSPEYTAELMLFFENNPELKEDLEAFDMLTLDVPETQLKNKEALKIDEDKVTALTFDDFAISEIEGLNTEEQTTALKAFLAKNPVKQKEFEVYQNTKLVGAATIFENKAALKQDKKVIPLYWWYSAAAAIILIVFLLKGINFGTDKPVDVLANDVKIEKKSETLNNQEIQEEVVPQENLIANKEEVIEQQNNSTQIKKKNNKKPQQIAPNSIEETPELLAEENKKVEQIIEPKDTATIQEESPKKENLTPPEDEFLYADDVVIVFEDDEPENKDDNTVASTTKKPTKFDAVAAAVKQQVKEKWLTKENGESIFALNDGGVLGFLKGKK